MFILLSRFKCNQHYRFRSICDRTGYADAASVVPTISELHKQSNDSSISRLTAENNSLKQQLLAKDKEIGELMSNWVLIKGLMLWY
jgi:hypothetical protein